MYNVVLRTIADCQSKGAITWTSYDSKEDFDKSYNQIKEMYEVVAEGVSEERAIELCSSTEAQSAAIAYYARHFLDILKSG